MVKHFTALIFTGLGSGGSEGPPDPERYPLRPNPGRAHGPSVQASVRRVSDRQQVRLEAEHGSS